MKPMGDRMQTMRMRVARAALAVAALAMPVAQASAAGPLSKIGKGEGALNLVAWEGYVDDAWMKP